MFDAFNTDQLISYLLHHPDRTSNNQNFQTVVGIKMNMKCGNDLVMMGMLVVG